MRADKEVDSTGHHKAGASAPLLLRVAASGIGAGIQ